jgi:serine/threonine protein kinase
LEHIHHRGYVHLDLKPDNIYVDENFKLKLADFDLSKSSDSKYKGPVGSYSYMAPEILEYKEYDGKQVDIFALGVTLFAMVSGGLPFSNAKYNDPIYKYFFMENERFFWERHEKE